MLVDLPELCRTPFGPSPGRFHSPDIDDRRNMADRSFPTHQGFSVGRVIC
jgi:hypothetical protein